MSKYGQIKKIVPIKLILAIGFVTVLTIANFYTYLKIDSDRVLGIETEVTPPVFWYDFLKKNPNYIPGWIEIGRPDKVKNIDPNYF